MEDLLQNIKILLLLMFICPLFAYTFFSQSKMVPLLLWRYCSRCKATFGGCLGTNLRIWDLVGYFFSC